MNITPGAKLASSVSTAQFVVIRGVGDLDFTHGGEPLVLAGEANEPTDAPASGEVLVGKRYSDETGDVELLCVRGGAGELELGGAIMTVKAAKALPASD